MSKWCEAFQDSKLPPSQPLSPVDACSLLDDIHSLCELQLDAVWKWTAARRADSLHRMELEHIRCVQMSLHWEYSIEVWVPPLHCWVNRSQLSEDRLLWSQVSDILHLNAEYKSITIKMARLVHAQTQNMWKPKGLYSWLESRWICFVSKPFIH